MNSIAKNARLNSIEALDLLDHKELFKSEEFTDAVCLILSQQTALKCLNLAWNDWSSEATTKIINTFNVSTLSTTIEKINLNQCCDWENAATCETLANFIATSPSLKLIGISPTGSKPIIVTVTEDAV